jgi:hypothetical protein
VNVSDGVFSDSESFWVDVTNSPVALAPISDLTVSYAAEQIEIPLPLIDADGDQLAYDVTVRGGDLVYQLDQTHDFHVTPDYLLKNYYYNKRKHGEKYLLGSDGSRFFILADGSLYRWKKSLSKSTYIATLDSSFYNDPRLLWDAQLAVLHRQSGDLSEDSLLIDFPVGSLDAVEVELNVSDGLSDTSSTFTVHVTNSPPVLALVGNHTMSSDDDSLQIPLTATDDDGDPITYSITQEAGTPAWQIDRQHGLHATSELLANDYYFNARRRREKYLLGDDGTWFFVRPGGKLYQWGTKIRNSKLIATLGNEYYVDPSLLYNAQPRGTDIAAASISGNILSIDPITGYVGSFPLTVTVSDGMSTDSETFFVTVAPPLETVPPPSSGSIAFHNVLYLNFDGADLSRDVLIGLAGDGRDALDTQFDPEGGRRSRRRISSRLDRARGLHRSRDLDDFANNRGVRRRCRAASRRRRCGRHHHRSCGRPVDQEAVRANGSDWPRRRRRQRQCRRPRVRRPLLCERRFRRQRAGAFESDSA